MLIFVIARYYDYCRFMPHARPFHFASGCRRQPVTMLGPATCSPSSFTISPPSAQIASPRRAARRWLFSSCPGRLFTPSRHGLLRRQTEEMTGKKKKGIYTAMRATNRLAREFSSLFTGFAFCRRQQHALLILCIILRLRLAFFTSSHVSLMVYSSSCASFRYAARAPCRPHTMPRREYMPALLSPTAFLFRHIHAMLIDEERCRYFAHTVRSFYCHDEIHKEYAITRQRCRFSYELLR